jgi:hypothetical protein
MTARGAGLLSQADLASLARLGRCEQLMSPGRLGLVAAGPHMYRKVAA